MNSILAFILVLGPLIFIHEFGHFLCAKLFGIRVLKFSLGFGPKVFGRTIGETEYLLSAFPLGGYVKMYGESLTDEVASDQEGFSFSHKAIWQRFLVVFAGPLFNLVFAVLLFSSIFAVMGVSQPVTEARIGAVTTGSPAATAGLAANDLILSINNAPVQEWNDVARLIKLSGGNPVTLQVRRADQTLTITGQPKMEEDKNIFGEVIDSRYMLGIRVADELVHISPGEAIQTGAMHTWVLIKITLLGIVKIIQKVVPASELGGPIRIAQMAGQQMSAGWVNLLHFTGLLSVSLGVLNLFPIPILDGGHLVFFAVEAIRRKPLSIETRERLQMVGLILLVSLMLFVFYNDFRFLGNGG
ncbi:RIP metalloprotease RseP [Thiovibrio frasassiensis]|uniref:Zinc metalloprotease n=1 Tax=Thiovibrio frasassiensis TaxID=2984131 RepID=A0A9X4MG42_9BACT|nr:RIP metalloprotease RseP [Thiovibrio frasassiensis]MDG4476879.1 RIP metalloprotease RseP [Thiovibrio frasassiensis]